MFPFAVLSPRGNRFLIFHLPLPVAFGWSQLRAQPAAPQPTALLLCFSYCQPELGKIPPILPKKTPPCRNQINKSGRFSRTWGRVPFICLLLCRFASVTRGCSPPALPWHRAELLCLASADTKVIAQSRDSQNHGLKEKPRVPWALLRNGARWHKKLPGLVLGAYTFWCRAATALTVLLELDEVQSHTNRPANES